MPTVIPLWFGDNTDISNECDLSNAGTVVGIVMPAEWTPAPVTVLVSVDGADFRDFCTGMSAQAINFNVVPSAIVPINPDRLRCAAAIKLRSGTADHPVIQETAREFGIITTGGTQTGSSLLTE